MNWTLDVTLATGDHTLTVFAEIYSADAYRGCHVQHSRNRVDVLAVRFAYLLSLSYSLPQYLSARWSVMAGEGKRGQGSLQCMKRPPLWVEDSEGYGKERSSI